MSGIAKKPVWPFQPNRRSSQFKGLYAWWPISQPKAKTVYELQRGFHATIPYSDPEENWVTTDARTGGGYSLNFNGSLDERANTGTVPTLGFPITITAWIKPTNESGWIISHGDGTENDIGWRVGIDMNSFLVFELGGVGAYTFQQLTLNKWQFVSVTVDADNGTAIGYVDMVPATQAIGAMSGSPNQFQIGGWGEFNNGNWRGGLDDIRIYNRVLTASELGSIYNAQTRYELYQSQSPDFPVVILAAQSTTFDVTGSGGIRGAGSATVYVERTIPVTSAGVVGGGVALSAITIPMSGGATVGGSAVLSATIVSLGGVLGAGLSPVGGLANEPPFGQAISGAKVGGIGDPRQTKAIGYVSSGQVVVGGATKAGHKSVRYNASGGVTLSTPGETPVNYKFDKQIEFLWNINFLIEKDITFYWSTGQLQIFWYRIIGKGQQGDKCDPLQADPCCQKFIMNVHARTLGELCEKLSKRRYKFPIESVMRFSRPAENSAVADDEANGINHDCNKLTPIEICDIPQCADFCVDQDLVIPVGFSMTVQVDSFFQHEASGNIFIDGQAGVSWTRNLPNFPYVASGGLTLGSETEAEPDHFKARGGVKLGGGTFLQASTWRYVGGNWPEKTEILLGNDTETLAEKPTDVAWQLTERAIHDDSLYTQSDISFGKTSQFLIVRDLRLNLPAWATIMGIKVRVDRKASQTGVRDEELYLVHGDDIISDNLADTNNDWPLIETLKIYGGTGLDGGRSWRDPNGEDYLGEWDIDELNSTEFGIAIRVRARNSLPATLARVDHMSIEVFYENLEGSILRVGRSVDVRCSGPSYHYTASGSLKLGSIYAVKKGMRFVSKGLGSNALPELQIGGHSPIGFYEEGSGGVALASQTIVSPYFEEGSGGAAGGGLADAKPYFEEGSGGMAAGGKVSLQQFYSYVADGQLTLSGDFFSPEVKYSYVASGGMTLGGPARVRCSNYKWVSDGNAIFVLGGADQKASDFGTPITQMEFSMVVLQTTATFLSDVDKQDAETLTGTVAKCGCVDIPLSVNLTHNLARDNNLAKFLVRNNFTIARTLPLKYNIPNDSWQANLHYRGLSSDTTGRESWDLIFELQCTDVMGGIGIGRSIWKLAIQIFRKNLTTLEDFESRILVGILPEAICGLSGNQLDFDVVYDTQLGFALVDPNATVYQNTIFDNIGLFKNRAWIEDPALLLSISQSSNAPTQRVDVTDSVFV